jgi:hypothetical protein
MFFPAIRVGSLVSGPIIAHPSATTCALPDTPVTVSWITPLKMTSVHTKLPASGDGKSELPRAMHGTPYWRTVIADSCGAINVLVNVAGIRTDAFWFSAVR